MTLVSAFQGQLKHADDCIHRGADLMAHGCQKCAFGPVGVFGQVFGGAQFLQQLAAIADVDPAADDALHFAQGIAIGKNPVVDGEGFIACLQWPVDDKRGAFRHDPQTVGLIIMGFVFITHKAAGLHQRLSDGLFAPG